jgi:hypothetical protein
LENDELRPPYLICALLAGATLLIAGVVLCLQRDDTARELASAVAASPQDLSQVIRLNQVYSAPPEEEDPSRYPKAGDASRRSLDDAPAKNSQ